MKRSRRRAFGTSQIACTFDPENVGNFGACGAAIFNSSAEAAMTAMNTDQTGDALNTSDKFQSLSSLGPTCRAVCGRSGTSFYLGTGITITNVSYVAIVAPTLPLLQEILEHTDNAVLYVVHKIGVEY